MRRWSRRKGQAQARPQNPDPAETAANRTGAECPDDEARQPTDADMPSIESLGEGSDYRGFLSPRVSECLRRAALRKLFQSPRFDVRDGLDDYDGDYTRYTPLGNTVTAHSKFHAERLRERLRAEATGDGPGPRTTETGSGEGEGEPGSMPDPNYAADSPEPDSEDGHAPGDDRG